MRPFALSLTAELAPPSARPSYPWLGSYAEVICRVKNTGAEPIVLTTWSCSWYQSWETDHPKVKVVSWPCYKNFPIKISLAPGQVYEKAVPLSLERLGRGEKLPLQLTFVWEKNRVTAAPLLLERPQNSG